jgi:capsular exopolysaccharide synthesis family protein
MNLSRILNIIRRFLWLFLLVIVVASLTTYFAISSKPAIYEAKARLLIGPGLDSPSPDLNSLRIGGQLIQTYAELVLSRPFLESVNNKLEERTDPEQLAAMIETRQNTDTRILTIFVRHRDPNQAVTIANAISTTLLEMSPSRDNTTTLLRVQLGNQASQLEQIIANSEASIEDLEARLVALGSANLPSPEAVQANLEQQNLVVRQLTEERNRMTEALRTLTNLYGVLRDTNTNQVQVIEPAGVVFPVDQSIPLRVAASGLAGLLLAIGVVFAFEYYSDKIRFPEDFSRVAKAPQLNIIEKHNRLDGTGSERVVLLADPDSRAANNYRTMVARLNRTIGESLPYSLLLSSVGSSSGEDAAMVAANLGIAFAQSGRRVVLLDAQFHNPQLTRIFEADEKAGLAEFLTAKSTNLKLLPIKKEANIKLLPAGAVSGNSTSSMLNSQKFANLFEELNEEADIILIAGSSLSVFAESLNLAAQVDGVILVAQPEEARFKVVNEVIENLESVNAPLTAIVFDNNKLPSGLPAKPSNVFEKAPVVSEDSHV